MEDIDIEAELKKIITDVNQIDRAIEKLNNRRQKLLSRKHTLQQKLQENATEKLANQDWERSDHPWSQKVVNTLKSIFKLNSFRPFQLSTINAVMSKQDCILLMPTGGGKSLCYQLPALVLEGITLVVSPLVSLMEDQIMAMEAINVPAVLLNANSTREHVNHVHKQMTEKNPSIKLLYVTPEKLAKSKRFMSKLEKMYKMGLFSLLAIDEVHCCSQWGHDFRTDYKFLGIMKRQYPNVPILGLTATATSSVINDVQKILNIPGCLVLKASFNRPNLKYEVVCKSSVQKDNVTELENLLRNRFNGLSGIIYCFSIKDSMEIATELRNRGIKARAYHAQLDAKTRSSVHKSWSTNSVQVIVATVAFGMGIDKPDVRFVIHYSMPKSMENFYQESGRAGRDDQLATCILFFRFPDIFRQSTMIFTEQKGLEHLYAMVSYCLDLKRCRRAIIAEHFGERWNSSDCNEMCDHCDRHSPYVEKMKNAAKECQVIYDILEHCNRLDERLTSQKLIDIWQGKGSPKSRPPGYTPTSLSRESCERIVALLLLDSYLIEEFHFTPYSTISYINTGSRTLPSNKELLLPMPVLRTKNDNSVNDNAASKTKEISKESSSSVKSQQSTSSSKKIKDKLPQSPSKKASTSSSVSSKNPVKLCVVNEVKSHFHNGVPSSTKKDSPANRDGKTNKKRRTLEEAELSDGLHFDDFEISTKKSKSKNSNSNSVEEVHLINESDSEEDVSIAHKKKIVNKCVPTITVSDESN
ncbi:ATP-dependent DNA helicase Q1 [Parasteatoda tepidariorum]|uniref:ATP-dependent DNA helicase Q1 n=1 Tax=Parasteatoda tepidariorum TaxID=114398 RepID=UPI00077F9AC6|nr:ATP-dependent DNA helicase Q1 [Parasteatoda tepidariorum]